MFIVAKGKHQHTLRTETPAHSFPGNLASFKCIQTFPRKSKKKAGVEVAAERPPGGLPRSSREFERRGGALGGRERRIPHRWPMARRGFPISWPSSPAVCPNQRPSHLNAHSTAGGREPPGSVFCSLASFSSRFSAVKFQPPRLQVAGWRRGEPACVRMRAQKLSSNAWH